jgi:hypothetical protein
VILDPFGRPASRYSPPPLVADAVEQWARSWGRCPSRVEFNEDVGCWVIRLARKADDPARRAVREGLFSTAMQDGLSERQKEARERALAGAVRDAETESVMLSEPAGEGLGYRALNIHELGPSGVVQVLDRANLWSGRGEHRSLQEGIWSVRAETAAREERLLDEAEQAGRDIAADIRRRALKIPYVGVGIDLKNPQPQVRQ